MLLSVHKTVLRNTPPIKQNTNVFLTLCFLTTQLPDGSPGLAITPNPFDEFDELAKKFGGKTVSVKGDEEKIIWYPLYGATSVQAQDYINSVVNSFSIPSDDISKADSQWWIALASDIGSGFLWMLLGLLSLWVFTLATGWIIRGFKGIPQGFDRKPDA